MKMQTLTAGQQLKLKKMIAHYKPAQKIIRAIIAEGGRALLVGGAVRDLLLGLPIKDLDIEVHNIQSAQLERVLKAFGNVRHAGKVFGVFRVDGLDIDWSLPRQDTAGRKPDVKIDPFMGMRQAFARRDLTVNAMGIDLTSYELIDPFDGYTDLKKGILRATDPDFFVEDPLRFYRVMQFIARFGMRPDKTLNQLCKKMDVSTVSKERIEQEFNKWLLKSVKPSVALGWLDAIDRLKDILPEVYALKGVPQRADWHPEGDVFEHTKQAIDAAAKLRCANEQERLLLMYAALCHDLGKATTTTKKNGHWTSYGHEIESVPLTKKLLDRISTNKILLNSVASLVRYHMQPGLFIQSNAKPPSYKRLAKKIAPRSMRQLALLFQVDRQARNAKKGAPLKKQPSEVLEFMRWAKQAGVLDAYEQPILQGRDLIGVMPPGPQMGEVLRRAYDIQINRGIKKKDQLIKLVLKKIN